MANCDLCGKKTELISALVEGTMLSVCTNCSKFGNVVQLNKSNINKPKVIEIDRYLDDITDDFAEKIKTAREKLNLKQEELALKVQEKLSVIQCLESGKIKPQISAARKLEKFLGIKLIETVHLPEINKLNVKDRALTIGDLINLEKK